MALREAVPACLRKQRLRGLLPRQRPRQLVPARLWHRPRAWARAEELCHRAPFGPPGPRQWPREDEYTAVGMPTTTTMKSPWRPLAKAKGNAAQAKAEAAAAGKAKARAMAMGKGGRALPEGALGPPSPCRWVRAVCLPRLRCQQRVRGSQRS